MLYLVLYFKPDLAEYYKFLQRVQENGAWKDWLRFFLTSVASTATQAVDAVHRILALFEADRTTIEAGAERAGSVKRVHEVLQRRLVVSQRTVAEETGLPVPTVNAALDQLEKLDVMREATGRARERQFVYDRYLAILSEGAEPLPR